MSSLVAMFCCMDGEMSSFEIEAGFAPADAESLLFGMMIFVRFDSPNIVQIIGVVRDDFLCQYVRLGALYWWSRFSLLFVFLPIGLAVELSTSLDDIF